MPGTTFFSALAAAIVMIISITGASQQAAAQQNLNICTYRVDIAGIPPHCFPINLATEWACPGGFITVLNHAYVANGVYAMMLNPPGAPPCPPACRFNWASLNPPIIPTPVNGTTIYRINGCCYILTVMVDINGMIVITIRPCPPDTPESL